MKLDTTQERFIDVATLSAIRSRRTLCRLSRLDHQQPAGLYVRPTLPPTQPKVALRRLNRQFAIGWKSRGGLKLIDRHRDEASRPRTRTLRLREAELVVIDSQRAVGIGVSP